MTTSVRQAEDDLQRAQAELARAARWRSRRLTAGIAHEVSQPLAAVITNARACLRQLDAGPISALIRDARWRRHRQRREARQRGSSRGARHGARTARTPVARFNVVVEDVLTELYSHACGGGVTAWISIWPRTLPPILGDRVQLQQLLLNLILNGADAMAEVTGRARTLTVRSWRADADRVALAVSDSGTGIEGTTPPPCSRRSPSAKGRPSNT